MGFLICSTGVLSSLFECIDFGDFSAKHLELEWAPARSAALQKNHKFKLK